MIVAWTNAPRLAKLAIVHPEASGDAPSVPVSWYGVARPAALSGCAGTMMSQLTLTGSGAGAADAHRAGRAEGRPAPLALALGLALAVALAAACWMAVCWAPPPETARTIPRVRPRAIGMASGTARRAARLRG